MESRLDIQAYSPDEKKPLAAYATLTTVFAAGVSGYIAAHARSGRKLPERLPAGDMLLLAISTQKLSRVITKDRVTSFIRSPFTRYTGEAGPSEVSEEARGEGLRLAIGELLVCPYCLGQWIAAALVGAYIVRPDATRMVAGVFATLSAADFLQELWVAVDKRA
jgi:Protein of unknown function (DUF1360)